MEHLSIPEARDAIRRVADTLNNPAATAELYRIAYAMVRKPYLRRRAPTQSAKVPASVLRRAALMHPSRTIADIAHEYGVNPGRVTEALRNRP
jgi:hypothetical protein